MLKNDGSTISFYWGGGGVIVLFWGACIADFTIQEEKEDEEEGEDGQNSRVGHRMDGLVGKARRARGTRSINSERGHFP